MPELPEVETMRRGIAGLCGARIVAARFPQGTCRPLAIAPPPTEIAARLEGHRIVSVARFGKRVAIEVGREESAPHWLVIEPRMTGLLLVAEPPTPNHVRMELEVATGTGSSAGACQKLLFWDQRGLGTIRLLDARGLDRACGAAKLGPDGLVVTGSDLAERLGGSRRGVKVALLDPPPRRDRPAHPLPRARCWSVGGRGAGRAGDSRQRRGPRGLEHRRRALPHRRQPQGGISKAPSRLRARRHPLPNLRRSDRAHRPGPTLDLLLRHLPAPVSGPETAGHVPQATRRATGQAGEAQPRSVGS